MTPAASRAVVGVLLGTIALAGVFGTRRAASEDAAPAPTKRFPHTAAEIDDLEFRGYPFVRAVECAIAAPDLDKEAMALAMAAWEQTAAHRKRLEEDAVYRAIDTERRGIARDPRARGLAYTAFFAGPYLFCVTDGAVVTDEALAKMSPSARVRACMAQGVPERTLRRVTEMASLLQQLYVEFLGRYGEKCGLRPLMDEYGGRADLPPGKRSFKDGCPLTVWMFSSRKDWDQFHAGMRSPVTGYFDRATGSIRFCVEESNRQFELNKMVHEGTHQLVHWFWRQKREWGQPVVPQSFFGEGFAEYIGAVTMGDDRKLTFHGMNVPRVGYLRMATEQLKARGETLPTFPLKDLVGLKGYRSVERWGDEHGMRDPLGIFYAQSWALVHFLNEYADHKYQSRFNGFLDDILAHPKSDSDDGLDTYTFARFQKRFDVTSDAEWAALEKEFDAWYTKDLIATDLSTLKEPPSLEGWPAYKPLRPIDPRDPTTWSAARK